MTSLDSLIAGDGIRIANRRWQALYAESGEMVAGRFPRSNVTAMAYLIEELGRAPMSLIEIPSNSLAVKGTAHMSPLAADGGFEDYDFIRRRGWL